MYIQGTFSIRYLFRTNKNTIEYKFCFRTDEKEEAKRMCEYLKIDISEENINIILGLGNGECLCRELDGE